MLVGYHMLGCFWYLCLLNCMQLYDKTLFTLAYPLCLLVCSVCGFLLLRWSLIYWCEHMWELLVVIRVMETPLRSLSWVGSPSSKFSFKAPWPMYYPTPWACILDTVKLLSCLVNGIVVCLGFLPSIFWITVRSDIYIPWLCSLYYSSWCFI